MELYLVFLAICVLVSPVHPLSKPIGDPLSAIKGLVQRILGESYVGKFEYQVIPDVMGKDVFEIDADQQAKKPVLRGNNGVSLASALNFYLKYTCNCAISWGRLGTGDQLNLPQPFPLPAKQRVISPVKYRYYQNVCTVSYSMAWWDFTRWQREIDWMAMNGLNLILSFTGQEHIWQMFYTSLGLAATEIKDFFSGAAFLAWQRMGNIQKWGGPLDDGWIASQAQMQIKILASTRQFGMINVLPGFAGHVPAGLMRVYPNGNYTRSSGWNGFNSTYSDDYLLEATDPLFVELGEMYYTLLISEFGTDHIYNADTYNEMNPSSTNLTFLADTNKAIYQAMANADKDAVFLMQGWLFHSGFWTNDRIKAFLSDVPNDKMIILDLNSEVSPLWPSTHFYFGKPFIWCLLHNYGGIRAIYGNLSRIATGPIEALNTNGTTMIGVGITPEGIEHNPIVYDLMGEMSWRSEIVADVQSWVYKYVGRRYGITFLSNSVHTAWQFLLQGAYQYHFQGDMKAIVGRAPQLVMAADRRLNATQIAAAWQLLMEAVTSKELDPTVGPLRYDLVDIGRQVLVNTFVDLHTMYLLAYVKYAMMSFNSSLELTILASTMHDLITDLDTLLASNVNFLLGTWISDARNSAPSTSPKTVTDNLEFNARNQITTWGPRGNIDDYATKAWSGLVGDYYYSRWKLLTSMVIAAVASHQQFNQSAYDDTRLQLEQQWSYDIRVYPTNPQGDTIQIANSLVRKYYPSMDYISEHFEVINNKDIAGHSVFGSNSGPWSRLISQVAWLCEVNPTCVGFNSLGFLKNSTDNMQDSMGSTLFLKKVVM